MFFGDLANGEERMISVPRFRVLKDLFGLFDDAKDMKSSVQTSRMNLITSMTDTCLGVCCTSSKLL